jgi:glutamate-1-semialdehyde 2,1-aminomutase
MTDAETYMRLAGDFVPDRVFDAHAHLYRLQDIGRKAPELMGAFPETADYGAWQSGLESMMGNQAPRGGLFFPFPGVDMDTASANAFLAGELASREASRRLMMIRPNDSPDSLDLDGGWSGFKVYHCFSDLAETQDALIDQFLPEWGWEIAHERNWAIMLHMVRQRSLADPENTSLIAAKCKRHPGARLILAHAARGFAGHHTAEGIESLRGLENVYFDNSVVCEPYPLWAILNTFGAERLLYGSDFPVSQVRGKAITLGDGFWWLYDHAVDWSDWILGRPALAGIESLHALKQAARMADLSGTEIQRIFYDNAAELFGL